MYSRPSRPIAASRGQASDASVAGPPSPENPGVPLPATVSMVSVAKSTRRMRWFSVSTM
jgi:hypothetical protein